MGEESRQSAKHGQPKKGSVLRKARSLPKKLPTVSWFQCAERSFETEHEPPASDVSDFSVLRLAQYG